MFKNPFYSLFMIVILAVVSAAPGYSQTYERAGWEAQLSTLFHNVSGTVRIVDEDTLTVENFHYDGGGLAVYFYLAQENTNASFADGIPIGPLLSGTLYEGDTLTLDLPPDQTLDDYNAISVWCVAVRISFGSGVFGSVVEYDVVFDATWSGTTHRNFPPNPHFSGLIGGTHNQQVSFWELDTLASNGIEAMAELGAKSPLDEEVNSSILNGRAYSLISGGGINPSPGSVTTTFKMNSSHPYVTLVSMIAPSPDWFVGVSSLPLFENDKWLGRVTVELYPYDAGTDSGLDFTSPNDDTNPQQPITWITGFPFENDPPLGTFTFRLKCDNPPTGDLNGDCRVDFSDLALLTSNWLLDCNTNPYDPRCQ